MANNTIQIKRSNTSSTPTTTLNAGELAFSYNSNSIFIGAQTGIGSTATKIGGAKYAYVDAVATAGVLTPTATLVTDANSYISNVYSSGLFLGPSTLSPVANATSALITSITPVSNTSQLGAFTTGSNTELATTAAIVTYVNGKVAASESFSNGTSYIYSALETFNANVAVAGNATSQILVGNSTVNVSINATGFYLGGVAYSSFSNGTAYTFSAAETFNANVIIGDGTTSELLIGTTASNVVANSTQITLSTNSTVNATVNATNYSGTANNALYLGGTLASGYQTTSGLAANVLVLSSNNSSYLGGVAAASYQLNSTLAANVLTMTANNSTYLGGVVSTSYVNTSGNYTIAGLLTFNGNVAIAGSGTSELLIGASSSNTIINSTSIIIQGGSTIGAYVVNSTYQYIGNSTVNTYSNATHFYSGNSTVYNYSNSLIDYTYNFTGNALFTTGASNLTFQNTTNYASFGPGALVVGNTVANVTVTSTQIGIGTATINATNYSGSANNAAYLNGQLPAYYTNATNITTGTLPWAQAPTGTVNSTGSFTFSGVETFNGNVVISGTSTGELLIGTTVANVVANATQLTLSTNATVYSTVNSTAINTASIAAGQFTANVTSASFGTISSIAASSANLTVNNMVISGNLTVTGSSTTLNTTNIQVQENFLLVADGNANVAIDVVDFGISGEANNLFAAITGTLTVSNNWITASSSTTNIAAGQVITSGAVGFPAGATVTSVNSTVIVMSSNFTGTTQANTINFYGTAYYGVGRVAAANAFVLFAVNTKPTLTTIGADTIMPLQAYLQPWGNSGAFVVNSTSITATANATVAVNISATSLSLSTPLAATSGGTAQNAYAAGDILYASATNTLSRLGIGAANGYILQVTNNLPAWGTLDGGTF